MDVTASLDAPCPPERLREWVADLDRYPAWLSIVPRADPEPPAGAGGAGGLPAWAVELRATLGPLARSKRLRMVRTVDETGHLRFERDEVDGRQHSPWVLDATVEPLDAAASRLVMSLHYGGSFGGNLLERLLGDEIEHSKPRLLALVAEG